MLKKTQQIELLEKLSDVSGASGFEEGVHEVLRENLSEIGNLERDSIMNLYYTPKAAGSKSTDAGKTGSDTNEIQKKPLVLLDAHMDEVGFIVQTITANGMLKFLPLGSWISSSVAAQKVRVRNREGKYIPGVIASKPPHYTSAEERNKAPDMAEMTIDIGAFSADEVRNDFKIDIAAPVVPDVKFGRIPDKEDRFIGKAFDCRIGCAAEALTLHALAGEELNVDVAGLFSTQEEVGARGIEVAVNRVKPDVAICFEGAPADDSFAPKGEQQTALGLGPMLRHFDTTMITNPRFQKFALDTAEGSRLPVQAAVRKGGGTNGSVLHMANQGIPTIVISVPVRYIHSHYGIACYDDYKAAADLAAEIIRNLNAEIIAGF